MAELEIKMLGTFSVYYVDGGERKRIYLSDHTKPKFLQMMQLVWLSGEEGITRGQLVQDIYMGKELSNPRNSINNLIHQARLHLIDAGCPQANYFKNLSSVLCWGEDVKAICDAERFHSLILKAREVLEQEQRDTDAAAHFYQEAVSLYNGSLLPEQEESLWVKRECARLAQEYQEAIHFADVKDEIWRESTWNLVRELQIKEKTASVRNDWNTPDSGDERAFLSDTPQKMHYYSWEHFIGITEFVYDNKQKIGSPIYLLQVEPDEPLEEEQVIGAKKGQRIHLLQECLEEYLKEGDAYTRYGRGGFLVLLIGYKSEEKDILIKKIIMRYQEKEGAALYMKAMPVVSEFSQSDIRGKRIGAEQQSLRVQKKL